MAIRFSTSRLLLIITVVALIVGLDVFGAIGRAINPPAQCTRCVKQLGVAPLNLAAQR